VLKVLGIISYGAALVLCIADTVLFGAHTILRACADRFLADGNSLTGWEIN
jgi:hypothetical protein